ncbi:MAG TPA: hypothetical protein VFG07_08640 [Thermoplasmata archaeon]|nr:hypothetical protein [Thermoplasmata archaeon]
MDLVGGLLLLGGLLLVFVLPGFTLAKAVFPEWRVRGRDAAMVAVQLLALSLVTSVAITILVGFALLVLPGQGFAASWSDPVLEGILVGVAVAGLVVGLVRGAYSHVPPVARALEPSPGADDGWQLVERLHSVDRERRRLAHRLRVDPPSPEEAVRQREVLEALDREAAALRHQRESEYGG